MNKTTTILLVLGIAALLLLAGCNQPASPQGQNNNPPANNAQPLSETELVSDSESLTLESELSEGDGELEDLESIDDINMDEVDESDFE